MSKDDLELLIKEVVDVEKKRMNLCGREKCKELLRGLSRYISERELTEDVLVFGDVEYGKIDLENVVDFYNKYIRT